MAIRHARQHRHFFLSYPVTLLERIYAIFIGPILAIASLLVLFKLFSLSPAHVEQISFHTLGLALLYTLGRLFVAYIAALIISVPLALLATWLPWMEKVFLPMFDILESVPVLAFFPILIVFFIRLHWLNGAAVFILFLAMVWNLVFTIVGGLRIIPRDILYAARIFKIRGFRYFKEVLLPSIFPEIVTGSILALAQGWNLIIVAEVLHIYIPGSSAADDLFGIGSILVDASSRGQTNIFIAAIGIMVLAIAFFNYFLWQRLMHYAERFKFE